MRLRLYSVIFLLLFFAINGKGQQNYAFLRLSNSPNIHALGGINVSDSRADVLYFSANPALLNSSLHRTWGLNFSPYFAQSNNTSIAGARVIAKGILGVNLQNLHYGTFQGRDALGNPTGEFSANDFSISVAYARKISNISFGISSKIVGSTIESFGSLALLTDWGGTFTHPKKDFSLGLVAKNIGFILKKFGNTTPNYPFDLQIGTTFKVQKLPLRMHITAHHIYQFDITDSNAMQQYKYDSFGNKILQEANRLDKLLSHIIFGGELFPDKPIRVLFGYNHLRRKELSFDNYSGLAGFSCGIASTLRYWRFQAAYSAFLPYGGQWMFGLIRQKK